MKRESTKSYSLEFKKASAKLANESDQPIRQTAKELGLNGSTLCTWIKQFYPDRNKKELIENDVNAELKQLKKDLLRVTQERDILKKAAAYFASEAL